MSKKQATAWLLYGAKPFKVRVAFRHAPASGRIAAAVRRFNLNGHPCDGKGEAPPAKREPLPPPPPEHVARMPASVSSGRAKRGAGTMVPRPMGGMGWF